MSVSLCSIFRNSVDYLDRYFAQVRALDEALGESVRLTIAEGDSTDDTYAELQDRIGNSGNVGDKLLKVDHGGPVFPPGTDDPARWSRIALVCNAVMDKAEPDGPLIYVESDLIWEPQTMLTLLEDLAVYPAVAPLSLRGGLFYDTWGHRGMDGQTFTKTQPFHADLEFSGPHVEIYSAGSCIVMRGDVAAAARFGDANCVVGLGQSIRDVGGSLWLDKRVHVTHP